MRAGLGRTLRYTLVAIASSSSLGCGHDNGSTEFPTPTLPSASSPSPTGEAPTGEAPPKTPPTLAEGIIATFEKAPYSHPSDVLIDGGTLIWKDQQTVNTVDLATDQLTRVYSDPSCPSIYQLAYDADNFYLGGCHDHDVDRPALLALSRADGRLQTIAEALVLAVARAEPDLFYVGCSSSATRLSAAAPVEIPGLGNCLFRLSAFGSRLLVGDGQTTEMDVSGGSRIPLGRSMVLTGNSELAVLSRINQAGDSTLSALRFGDRVETLLVTRSSSPSFRGAAIVGSTVYYTSGAESGEVGSISLVDGSESVLAQVPWPGAMAVDEHGFYLYWEEQVRFGFARLVRRRIF